MYQKLIINDIKKSKLITLTVTIFIMAAAMFAALGVSMLVNLLGAMDKLMMDAKAPYYLQMHSGDIDLENLEQFAAKHEEVEAFQAAEFLNIEGMDIVNGEKSLSDSVQDNGVATQNKEFDFLLDLDNQIIWPKDGEIYVPIYYMTEDFAEIGDTIAIHGVSFTVAGFVRDAQMNSALSSSKRFLISENDYEQLREFGKLEYLIEFRVSDQVTTAAFESLYTAAGLPANGPSGSYGLVKMMNGISDGIMIALLMLVSLLILLIAFLSLRFTLISKMEEDYKEIGVLKAIGLRVSAIKKLYIVKYSIIAATGCGLGFLVSLLLQKPMLTNIRIYMGVSGKELLGIILGLCSTAVVYVIVMSYVNGVLRRFRKVSATQAIRCGAALEQAKVSKGFSLADNHLVSSSVFLGIKDVFVRKKLYLIMLFVLVISCFIMVVPQNIYNTVRARSFMTHMGIGECDIRLDIQLADQIPEKTKDIGQSLSSDEDVERFSVLTCWMFDMPLSDGGIGTLKVELGDHSLFPLTYDKGRDPQQNNEIALSTFNAEELKKDIGDTIVLVVDGQERELTVCGLYSDVTYGGLTAKATFQAESNNIMWAKIPVKLKDISTTDVNIASYKEQFSYAKVSKIDDHLEQSFGTAMDMIQTASFAAILASVLLTVLITLLFMKMIVIKDRYQISVLKSLGFTTKSIRQQYMVRSGVVLILVLVIGTVAANTLGELIGGALIASLGISGFHFNVNWLFTLLVSPAVMAVCVYGAARLGTSDIKSIKVSEYIKE